MGGEEGEGVDVWGGIYELRIMNNIDEKLREVQKVTGAENRYWICGPETGRFLYDKVVEVGAKNVLEFGTSVGYSAMWMVKALMQTGGHIWTVESHKERGDSAADNFRGLEAFVTLVRGHAPEVLSLGGFPEMLDLVFFDATKYEHLSYFEAVYPKLRDGGILIVDNVISHGEGNMMREFLKTVKEHPCMRTEILNIGSGLMVSRKDLSAQ